MLFWGVWIVSIPRVDGYMCIDGLCHCHRSIVSLKGSSFSVNNDYILIDEIIGSGKEFGSVDPFLPRLPYTSRRFTKCYMRYILTAFVTA